MKTGKIVMVIVGMALPAGSGNSGFAGTYTAKAYLRIQPQESFILAPLESKYSEKEFQAYRETHRQLVKSRFVLLAALRKREVAKLPSVQQVDRDGDAVRWLEKSITVDFPGDAEIMSISVTRSDPKEAAVLTNAVVDAYVTDVVDAERNRKRIRLAELDRAYVEKETDIRAKREELKRLTDTLGVLTGEPLAINQKLALEEWSEYQKDLRQIRSELRGFRKDLASQKALLSDAKEADRAAIQKTIKQLETSIAAMEEQELSTHDKATRIRKEAERIGGSSVDIDMMRNDIKNSDDIVAGIAKQRELMKTEIRAASRITLLSRADAPGTPD